MIILIINFYNFQIFQCLSQFVSQKSQDYPTLVFYFVHIRRKFLSITANTMPTAVSEVATVPSSEGESNKQTQLMPPAVALLAELGESSRNLPNASSSLGTIQLGLNEISKRAFELRKDLPVDNNTKA